MGLDFNKLHEQHKADIILGQRGESETEKKIQKYFQNDSFKQTCDFHSFDFFSEELETFIEVKTRRIKHNGYRSIIFSAHKIQFIKNNPEYDYYFIFNCRDGFYIWKYNPKQFFLSEGGRRDRGKIEKSRVCNVFTEFLKKM